MVIKTFSDRQTLEIYEGNYSKKAEKQLPKELWGKARRILEALDSADELQDLKLYGLDEKTGALSRLFSLRINDQYRVLFRWMRVKPTRLLRAIPSITEGVNDHGY